MARNARVTSWRRHIAATCFSLAALAVVSAAIYALDGVAPVLSLGVLYLFAVLPVAALWGLGYAVPVSIVSLLAFNFLFLPPRHTLRLADSENWVALAVYLCTAIVVSGLAARARRRAAEAEQRRREAAFAAEVSALLLEADDVREQLERIAARVASMLGASEARIELSAFGPPAEAESVFELAAGERRVGRLVVATPPADADLARRVAGVLASLLATALDREELARHARESEARRHAEAIEAEALRRSDAAKTAVLRSVSHDLRSPITAVMTAGEVLASSAATLTSEEQSELLDSIGTELRKLDRLVSNLLDLSRLEAGAAAPVPELWTADGLVSRALDAIGPENERVAVELAPQAPPVSVDAAQVERALVNLLENALKFSPLGSRVRVRSELLGDEVVVQVVDSGPGIAAAERLRVFEPFQRGEHGDDVRGSGLGLAIARGFAQVNGGRVWVDSEPGRGATFSLAFPVAEVTLETIE